MGLPIRRKLDCECGLLRSTMSHRRGKFIVYELGYIDKDKKEVIQKLELECITCNKKKEFILENKNEQNKKRKTI
jgi:hypothetical protein